MNSTEIENKLLELSERMKNLSSSELKADFIYDFMLAYKIPKATVSRIKTGGNVNLSKIEGQIILKNRLWFESFEEGENLLSKIDELKSTVKHNPRFIMITDYKTIVAFDTKLKDPLDISFSKLAKHYDFFLPLAKMEKATAHEDNPADRRAAEAMARLYDQLLIENNFQTKEERHNLNIFLSRILFCFFAEDTGIFKDKTFEDFLNQHTLSDASDLSDQLTRLFDHLNNETPSSNISKWLSEFPYVNGNIFKDASPKMKFNSKARKVLIECAELNWKDINPDIFGSMIQAVVDPRQRGSLGMHYTSVENIMKVIDPLFLDNLNEELDKNRHEDGETKNLDTRKKNNLNALLKRISEIRIFDPACGSGNFLIIAYKEMSRLEMEVLDEIDKFGGNKLKLASISNSRITLNQFYGIEIDDFAHEIAMLSLHLAKHQMNMEFLDTFGHANPTLPLKDTGQIKSGNALRVDWNNVCPREKEIETYILGNPPYLGSRYQKETHRNDMAYLLSSVKNYKKLDYISGWFFKGKKYIEGMNAKCAFVSTNSICQGEQVSILWKHLINKHIEIEFSNSVEIEFAHPSFKWVNNAKYNAGVTVIIIGIRNKSKEPKYLYNGDIKTPVGNINSYLTTGQNIFLKKSRKSISNLPKIERTNPALDNGHYLLSCAERENLLKENPLVEKIIKPVVGAAEFLKGHKKYCLWIKDEDLEFANSIKTVKNKISKVKEYRTGKSIFGSINPVEKAHQFLRMKMAKKRLLFIPTVSSERRRYLPIGIFDNNTVIIDPNFAIYDPEIYIFGVISSKMHMQWMKTFTGRLETRLRYSSTLCYNTFPFPSIDESQKKRIDLAVDGVLRQRAKNYELTMAQLYDPDKMPKGLVDAHNNLDLIIEQCYRKQPFLDDAERLEYLFKMYEKMTGNE